MRFIKLSTLLPIASAVAAGALLFWTSQNVQQAEDKLSHLQASVKSEEQTIRVLHAEWDYLNRPDRLEDLATRHLGLSSAAAFSVSSDMSDLPTLTIPIMPPRKPFIKTQAVTMKTAKPKKPVKPRAKNTKSFQSLLKELNTEGVSHE